MARFIDAAHLLVGSKYKPIEGCKVHSKSQIIKTLIAAFAILASVSTVSGQHCGLTISPVVDSFGCVETTAQGVWSQGSNVTITGSNIEKTSGGTSWNAGAFGTAPIEDFGYVQTIIAETNRERAFGLSAVNGGNNMNNIQFAFRLRNDGILEVREGGTNRGSKGPFTAGDTLRIQIENGVVNYLRNGQVIHVSIISPSLPLYADAAIRQVGGTINAVTIGNYSNGTFVATTVEDVTGLNPQYQWLLNGNPVGNNSATYSPSAFTNGDIVVCELNTDAGCAASGSLSNTLALEVAESFSPGNFFITGIVVDGACQTATEDASWDVNSAQHMAIQGGIIRKVQGGTNWNSNLFSLNAVHNNGSMQFIPGETNREKAVGLSHTDGGTDYNTIQYAFHMRDNGELRIRESGINRGTFGSYNPNDVLRIAVENGNMTYYRNETVLYISNVDPTLPLYADLSFRHINSSISALSITNLNAGSYTAFAENAGDNPSYQWYLNGNAVGSNAPTYENSGMQANDVLSCALSPDLGGCNSLFYPSNLITKDALPEAEAINFFITGSIAESACNSATEDVQWIPASIANVQASGNNLTKIQGGTSWNGNAASLNTVQNNGRLQFTTSENNLAKAAGLSHVDVNGNYTSIDYAFYLENNASLRIFESGVSRGTFGTYQAGDVLEIEVDNGVVKYYRNGNLLRISAVPPTLPLLADVSLRQINATINNVQITNLNAGTFVANAINIGSNPTYQWHVNGTPVGSNTDTFTDENLVDGDVITCSLTPDIGGCQNVTYQSNAIEQNIVPDPSAINFYITGIVAPAACFSATEQVQWSPASLSHTVANGSNLEKIQGGTNWNGNAFSSNRVENNGSFAFSTDETNLMKAVGLSSVDASVNFNQIEFCFYLESNGNVRIYESGLNRGTFGTYSIGDNFELAVVDGVVQYFRNGNLLRISTVSPTMPLYADVSLRNVGATVTNARITNLNAGTFTANAENAGSNPTFQWSLNGLNVGNNNPIYTNNNLQEGDELVCILTPDLNGCQAISYTSNAITQDEVSDPVSINFFIAGEAAASACYVGSEQVRWNNESLLNVQATGNSLIKVQGGNNYNANASSLNTVRNGGAFSFRTGETNRTKAVGLSHTDAGIDRNSIQYALTLESNGSLKIFESGADRGTYGTYTSSDSLGIKVENNVVMYTKNGEVVYISNIAPTLPLLVDVSLATSGGTLTNALVTNLNDGTFTALANNAGDNPVFQWKLNGTDVGSNSTTYSNNALNDGDIVTCELSPDLGGCGALTYTSNAISHRQLPAPEAINFFITGTEAAASCHTAVEEVRWNSTSLSQVIAEGNNLIKVQSTNSWNGNAASLNRVYNDGAFSFSTSENNRAKAIGLSQADVNASFASIQFCFYMESNGNLRIFESNNNRGAFGTYSPGDSLSIAVESGVVKYYNNGQLLYISAVVPNMPLLVDASLHHINATISNARISNLNAGTFTAQVSDAGSNPTYQWLLNGQAVGTNSASYSNGALNAGDIVTCALSPDLGGCESVTYTSNAITKSAVPEPEAINFFITGQSSTAACNAVLEEVRWDINALNHVVQNGNSIVKVQSPNNWNGNASSLNRVHNNGSFQFGTSETNLTKAIGLSSADINAGLNSIQFGFYLEGNGNLRIYESGANRGTFGTYNTNDVLRIAVEDMTVLYFRNDQLLYQSTVAPNLPLLVDASLYSNNSSIRGAYIKNRNEGGFMAIASNAGANPLYTWRLNGQPVGTNSATYTNASLQDGDIITCEFQPDLEGCATVLLSSNTIEVEQAPLNEDVTFFIEGTPDADGFGYAVESVVWNSATTQLVQIAGSNMNKVQSNGVWNAGGASVNTVKDNGYFEFLAAESNRRKLIGLSSSHANKNFNSVRYGFYLDGTTLRVVENGTTRGSYGAFAANDVLRIAVENGVVRYYRNGTLLFTSSLAPSLPLLVDVRIRDVGGTVTEPVVVHATGGAFTANAVNAGANPSFQWRRNGVNVGSNQASYTNPILFEGDVVTCTITPDLDGCSTSSYTSNEIVILGPGLTTNWTGAVSSQWNLGDNWSDGLPNANRNAVIEAGSPNWPAVNVLSQVLNLEVQSGAELNFAGSNTLQVYGNINNEGAFNPGSGTIVALGEGSRTYSGTGLNFNRLIVNLAASTDSIVLDNTISIAQETMLLSGVLYTDLFEVVYLNGAESRNSSALSYVDGVARKIGNEAFLFPVGRAGIYAPVSISAPDDANAEFTAEYIIGDPQEAGYSSEERGEGIRNVSSCEYWMINREESSSAVRVTLSYEDVRSCGVTDPTELLVLRWNGSEWQNHGYLSHEGTVAEGTITSGETISQFSPFALGSGSAANPLPVDLLSFAAKAEQKKVRLTWSTASEINNDFFTIERSADGQIFEEVAKVQGAGNASSRLNYSHVDHQPLSGTSYYRLTQTDFDGTSKTYPMQAVYMRNEGGLMVYPNPAEGQVHLQIIGNESDANVKVISVTGKVEYQKNVNAAHNSLDLSQLAPGAYIVQVEQHGTIWTEKLLIQR